MTKIRIEVEQPSDLPPTREEKWVALREKAEELMEMADVGHNEEYCLRCLNVLYRKLKSLPTKKHYTQELEKRIKNFILRHTGDLPNAEK